MMLSNIMSKKASPVPKAEVEPDYQHDLNFGMQEEAKEHAWLTPAQVRRLVTDHLKMDPAYYEEDEAEAESGTEEPAGSPEDEKA